MSPFFSAKAAFEKGASTLTVEGSVRRLKLSIQDINDAFNAKGDPKAIARPEPGKPDDLFIELFAASYTNVLEDHQRARRLRESRTSNAKQVCGAVAQYRTAGAGVVEGLNVEHRAAENRVGTRQWIARRRTSQQKIDSRLVKRCRLHAGNIECRRLLPREH